MGPWQPIHMSSQRDAGTLGCDKTASSALRDPKAPRFSGSARRAFRVGWFELAFLRIAQALFERGQLERLLQHEKALLRGIAYAVAVAGREQHRRAVIALADGAPEIEASYSARHQDIGKNQIDLRSVAEQ